MAHYTPWLTHWWTSQNGFPVDCAMSGGAEYSRQDLEIMPKLAGRQLHKVSIFSLLLESVFSACSVCVYDHDQQLLHMNISSLIIGIINTQNPHKLSVVDLMSFFWSYGDCWKNRKWIMQKWKLWESE